VVEKVEQIIEDVEKYQNVPAFLATPD